MVTVSWSAERVLSLPLFVVLLVVQGTFALKWTNHRFPNGTTVHRCVGADVTFPWSFDAQNDPSVTLIFWYSEKNGTIATSLDSQFVTYSDRVTYVPNAGVTISGLTSDDRGTYGVELFGSQRISSQEARLVVVELPKTVDPHIYVKKESRHATSTRNDTCDPQVELLCGQFLSTGHPAVSVEWTDPQGKQLPGTGYRNGYFTLSLPPNHKGGNYTCSLLLNPEMSKCQGSNQLFGATSVSIFVETTETKVKNHEESIALLQEEVQQALKLQNETDHSVIEDMAARITVLESAVVNATEGMNKQHQSAQRLSSMKFDHLQDSLEDLEKKMEQSLSDKASSLSKEVRVVSDAVSKQAATSVDQQQAITDQNRRMEHLESQLVNEQQLSSQLEARVTSLVTMLNDQKDEFDAKVLKQDQEIDRYKQINSQFTDDLVDLKIRLAALSKTLQSALQQQNTSVQSLGDRLENEVQAQGAKQFDLENAVDLLNQTVTNSFSNTTSRLNALGQALQTSQQNLTDYVKASQTEQSRLLGNSLASIRSQSLVTQSLQANLTKLDVRVAEVAVSVNSSQAASLNELSALRENVTDYANKYRSLQTRVQSVERRGETPRNRIIPVRLVGGSNQREGRVEILVGGIWGTVCDDSWGNEDAKVVCTMLGYFGSATARTEAAFGAGTGRILLDDVDCTGYELDIRACKGRGINHNCNHNEDAGVVCS